MNLREASKGHWSSSNTPTIQELQAGALQRIADACESMSVNYKKLQSDLEWYQGRYKAQSERAERAERRVSALKGVITRMKKRMVEAAR